MTDFFGTLKGRTLMNFLKAMFGNYSKREVKRVQPICDKVLALEDKYAAMSESELKNQTTILKERLANGETRRYSPRSICNLS